jgi:type VI secretion system protein ImpL
VIRKALKVLLLVVALVCLWVLSWLVVGFVGAAGWFTWVIFFGVLATIGLVVFFERQLARHRAKITAVRHLVTQEAPETDLDHTPSAMRRRFREGLIRLRTSALRKDGDPRYVLPWFMMLGPGGAGKTAALVRARLESAMTDLKPSSAVTPTTNCDWYFFERAVVLDTAGRFSQADPTPAVNSEWEALLGLVAAARRREPLNGVIVTIDAPRLLDMNGDKLLEEARFIRKRIVQLMTLMDVRFPVYLLVTKLDQLYGFAQLSQAIAARKLEEPMGYIADAHDFDEDPNAPRSFLNAALRSVSDRLRDLRLALLQRADNADSALLLFPNEIERLRPGLEVVLTALFGANPYVETPMMRGLFFASAEQSGVVSSAILASLGATETLPKLPDSTGGMFLHDFFGDLIPSERGVHTTLARRWQWDRITQSLGLTSWLVLNLIVGVGLCYAFLTTFETLQRARELYPTYPAMTGTLAEDLPNLNKFRGFIHWMEERNESALVRWTPFNNIVKRLDLEFMNHFVDDFNKFVAPETDELVQKRFQTVDNNDPAFPLYVYFLTTRINANQARLDGADYDQLYNMPMPRGQLLTMLDPKLTPELTETFSQLFLADVAWKKRDIYMTLHVVDMRNALDKLISSGSENLSWLAQWADQESSAKAVALDDFWPGSGELSGSVNVSPAFTKEGRAAIAEFLTQLSKATPAQDTLTLRQRNFWSWYRQQQLDAWYRFAANFDLGRKRLTSEADWRLVLPSVDSARGPYFAAMTTIEKNLDTLSPEDSPPWLAQVRTFNLVRATAERTGLARKSAAFAGAVHQTWWRGLLDTLAGRPEVAVERIDEHVATVQACEAYVTDLGTLSRDAMTNTAQSDKIATAFYGYASDPKAQPSPLYSLYDTVDAFKKQLASSTEPIDPVVWSLVNGPLRFLRDYVDRQTACYLQSQWASDVLFPLKGAAVSSNVNNMLYGQQGSVWAFMDGPASPFVRRNAKVYTPVDAFGQQIPFSSDLFVFVNGASEQNAASEARQRRAALQQQRDQLQAKNRLADINDMLAKLKPQAANLQSSRFEVTVKGLPSSVNQGAGAFPYATILSVNCGAGPFTVTNYNFPVERTLTWSPSLCGDTTLKILFDRVTLSRTYSGPYGFADFVKDFYDGSHIFTPADFPDAQPQLDALGVKQIKLYYRFSGQGPILDQLTQLTGLPDQIASLEAEQNQLQANQQNSQLQQIDDDLAQLDKVSIVRSKVPQQIAQCWGEPASAPPPPPSVADGKAPKLNVMRNQSNPD